LATSTLVLGLCACTGVISNEIGKGGPSATGGTGSGTTTGGTGSGTTTGGTGTGGGTSFACPSSTPGAIPSPLHRLTPEQYLNSVRDLLGDIPAVDSVFSDVVADGAYGLVQADVAQVDLEKFQTAAEAAGAAIVADANKMKTIAPCATGADRRGCARTFVTTFGSLAYRAPVTDSADIDRHLALYDAGATTSYEHGIEMIIRGILQAPRFLYRFEFGTADKVSPDAVKLSSYELGTRLSYAVWNTMPDAKLTMAAASGALATKDGVTAQLQWMLQDPRGTNVLRRFLQGWIEIADLDTVVKDTTMFPDWNGPTVRNALQDQSAAFFDYILANQKGSLGALLTSPTVFFNKTTASYYGATSTSDTFQSMDLTDGTAAGLLTLPGLLADLSKPSESWPIYRGKFVREQLLCQELPAPPANVPPPPEPQPGVTMRQRFAIHETNAACSACHLLIDPIGFAFESYDAVGKYRKSDANGPIDVSGEILLGADDVNGKFVGVGELGKKLATATTVQACMSRQWFRFFLRRYEQDVDGCSMKSILDTFKAKSQDLNSLPLALVQTDAFLYRSQVSP
jgi:hypothetical protein